MAQISGLTYRDSNGNGNRETHVPAETVLSGISVKAFDASNMLISQTYSDAAGRYTLNVPSGQSVRVVFGTGDEKGSLPAVRYVRSPSRDIDFGLYNPDQYASQNPIAISPVYILGKGNDTLTALLAIATETGERTPLATAAQVGALWGVAYHRQTRHVYSAAFAKRHVGYGPLGTGGIYRTDWNTRQTTVWLDLKTLGIPTGIDRHKDLTAHPYGQNVDAEMMGDVGTASLGGMDILDNTLFVANLADRQVYGIALPTDPSKRPGVSDVKSYSLPDPGWKGGAVRPFAIKAYQGKLYVGVVCDAAQSQSVVDLKAGVYELDPISGRFRLLLTIPLAYSRGTTELAWHPWTSDFAKARQPNAPSSAMYPQPILSAIEFDADGGIILGLMDRFGHQAGTGQPDPTGEAAFSAIAAGDVLKVFPSRKNYKLEANAAAGDVRSAGAGNRQGPDGGEFFFEDGFVASDGKVIHDETAAGGLAWLPGTGELLASSHEPGSDFNNSGIKAFGNQTGKRTRSWAFYSDGQAGTFGKANGMGGIALVTEAPGVTIGGRLWTDANLNGQQDANETGVPETAVDLYFGGKRVASTQTDTEGRYRFGGLVSDQAYEVKLAVTGRIATIPLAVSDFRLDSDAKMVDQIPTISFHTGKTGDYLLYQDFGTACQSNPAIHPQWVTDLRQKRNTLLLTEFDPLWQFGWKSGDASHSMRPIPENGILLTSVEPQEEVSLTLQDSNGCVVTSALRSPVSSENSGPDWGHVFPNPACSEVTVQWTSNNPDAVVSLLEITGKELIRRDVLVEKGHAATTLSVRSLSVGSYLLRVVEHGKTCSTIVIKQ